MRIATQGQPASFHYQAVDSFFPNQSVSIQGFDTFRETFEALATKQAEFAVVAVENSIHGAINESYDLLDQHHAWICGEVYLHIEQCLIGLPGASIAKITDVYSHFAALSQCREYLHHDLPQAKHHVHADTAGAVADVKKWNNPNKAAIASAYAADYYGLPVLAKGIETDTRNYTRFALLSREHQIPKDANKTSLLVQLHSHPGALHEVLGIFAIHNLDLTMLVSRPIIGKPGDYQFYMDIAASAALPNFLAAKQAICNLGCQVRVLGSYKPVNSLGELTDQNDK